MIMNSKSMKDESYASKCIASRNTVFLFFLLALNFAEVNANASLYASHWHQDYPSTASYNDHIIRSRRSQLLVRNDASGHDRVVATARKTAMRSPFSLNSTRRSSQVSINRLFTGTVRVITDVVGDYVLGFCVGYAAGTIFGLPAVVFRSGSAQIENRMARMNSKSVGWGLSLGEVLGTFTGCDTAVRLIRYPRNDVWNPVIGCATAGAVLARNQGSVVMAQSALLWGAVMYVLETTSASPVSRLRSEQNRIYGRSRWH